jgi:hypothetical protein
MHRQVLVLHLEEYDLAEIAARLGIPYHTAGTRLHNTRKKLQACLESKGYRFVPRDQELPPGAEVVMVFTDELLIYVPARRPEGSP